MTVASTQIVLPPPGLSPTQHDRYDVLEASCEQQVLGYMEKVRAMASAAGNPPQWMHHLPDGSSEQLSESQFLIGAIEQCVLNASSDDPGLYALLSHPPKRKPVT